MAAGTGHLTWVAVSRLLPSLSQAFAQTRDQRCLTSYFVHCAAKRDITLDYSQTIVSTLAGVPLRALSVAPVRA
eukprot:SAG25_NODE_2401_length_1639_cov_5.863061_3_plen_74_part_00